MNLGAISLTALATAVTLSCTTRLNVGLIAMVFAWIIGVYLGGMPVRQITAGFPVDLFLTLAGVTLLFSQAQVNGTLERVAHNAVRVCRGRAGLVPILFFLLASALATAGPGNIATAGLLAPMAMSTALRMKIPPFLMAIMVANGANSGSLSPLAPTGIIVNGLMARIGLAGFALENWFYNFFAHTIVAFAGYFLFGGLAQLRRADRLDDTGAAREPLERNHLLTLAAIGLLVATVLIFKVNIGMAAFAAAVFLTLARASDEERAIRGMPWGTIMMVCGVTVLIGLLEKTSGMDIFTGFLTSVASEATMIPLLAVVVGLISAYSSTSGVVLPAFLPMVPKLGVSAFALAQTMNVAGHLVDVSPLSTIGALCVASIPAGDQSRRLFNQLLAWGLGMTVTGALLCWLLFGRLA